MDNPVYLIRKLLFIIVAVLLITLACNLPTSAIFSQGRDGSAIAENAEQGSELVEGDNVVGDIKSSGGSDITNTDKSQLGLTRSNPYPIDTHVSLPGWDIKVLEFKRGEDALQIINTDNFQVEPLTDGYEFVLAKVYVRCTSMDDKPHYLGISDMAITGSKNRLYGDRLDGRPAPEFLFEDMYSAETVEGWVDAVVDVTEDAMMLIVDLDNYPSEGHTRRYFALEEGASISLSQEMIVLKPNGLGDVFSSPAPLGQPVITQDWEVTLLESARGPEVLSILQLAEAPEPEIEYLIVKMRLRYINKDELPAYVYFDRFFSYDESGNSMQPRNAKPPEQSDLVWIWNDVLPGAILEGWVPITIPIGYNYPIIGFYTGEKKPFSSVVYFAVNR